MNPKTFLLAAAWLALTANVALAADKRAITHEDLWLLKRVGSPVPSPDGKWVVFSVSEPAYEPKDASSDLWLRSLTDDTPARRITSTKGGEGGVDWSPDSGKIVFSAKRDGDEAPQLYVLDLQRAGEAERITQLSTGARAPQWSPDGKRVLFVSEVFPGAADEEANKKIAKERRDRKYHARVYESFPIRYWDHWLDDKQAHLFVQDAKAGATPRDLLAGSELVKESGFSGRQGEAGEDLPATWTPDGAGVVFVAARTRDRAAFAEVPTQLFEVAVAGGEPRQLTYGADNYDEPRFRPDGKALLVGFEPGGDGKTYHHTRLVSFAWPFASEKRVVLSSPLDLSVVTFAPSADSKTVYFTAEAGDQVGVFAVPAAGGAVTPLALTKTGNFNGFAVGGGALVASYDNATQPPEIARIDPVQKTFRVLTQFNAEKIAQLDLPPVERFQFTSAKGRTIHNLLVRPAGFDAKKKYPLFVVIHGGPAPQFKDAWGLRWNYHLLAAPGYVLLLTNYSGSSGYAEEFGQAIQNDPLKTPGDEINQAADEAIKRYAFIDATRQAAGGASYGGHLANWLQATTTRYKCLISHAGLVNLETQWGTSDGIYHREVNSGGPTWEQGEVWREQSPARLAGNHFKKTGWVTPMLMTVGEQDFRVPLPNTLENWSYHQRLQIPSKLIVFPEENHWVLRGENSRFWFGEVHAWLAKWLK